MQLQEVADKEVLFRDDGLSELLCCCNDCKTAFQTTHFHYRADSVIHCVRCGNTKVKVISENQVVNK